MKKLYTEVYEKIKSLKVLCKQEKRTKPKEEVFVDCNHTTQKKSIEIINSEREFMKIREVKKD